MSALLEAQEPTARNLSSVQPALAQHFGLLATASGGMVRLRELVLTLAIEGKLVPQDPRDAPAGALLARVQARRKQLVAEGKIKAGKSEVPSANQHSSFDLPYGWEWICAADVCVVITDGDYQAPPKAESGVPFLVIGDVRDGAVGLGSATRFVPLEYFNALDWGKRPLQGDILYTTVGSLGIPVPVVQQQAFCFQRHIALLRPGLAELQAYITLALRSRLAFDQAASGATGIAQKTVPLSVLRRLRLPLPPLAEQSRIVARVEELMRLCDALEAKGQLEAEQHARLLGTLLGTLTDSSTPEELAANWQRVADHFDLLLDRPEAVDALEQTILQLAVRGLLVPQDPDDEPASLLLRRIRSDKERLMIEGRIKRDKPLPSLDDGEAPFQLPTGWSWVRLGSIAGVERGGAPRPIEAFLTDSPEGLNWIKIGDSEKGGKYITSTREKIRPEGLSKTRKVYPGDFLLTNSMSFGRPYITQIEGCIHDGWLRISPPSSLDKDYLYLLLSSSFMRELFTAAAAGGVVQNLNADKVRGVPIPVPPLAEQTRIVTRAAELRRLCADLRQRLERRYAAQAALAEALIDQVTAP